VHIYTRREVVVLLAIVVLGAAGVAVDRWRRDHPETAARLELLDRVDAAAPGPSAVATPPRTGAPTIRTAPTRARTRGAGVEAPIDLNRASRDDLERLPGVGPGLAARIVEARARDGPFESVDDLRRVRGVGRATLERLRPLLAVNAP
jgi:competence protein ComEA